jgi:CBS domain-containing protein
MSTGLVTVHPSVNLTQAAREMSISRVGSVLVIEDGALIGIFTERDIMRALAEATSADNARVSLISERMVRDPVTIGPDDTLGEALNRMLDGGFRHLPVMDGDTLMGLVSMRDIAMSVSKG